MNLIEWAERWNIPPEAIAELRRLPNPLNVELAPAVAKSEADTQNQCRLRMSQKGGYLWRNNSGAFKDDRGHFVRYGLGNDSARINAEFKSPDLVGIAPKGLFAAFEVKHPGWRGPENDRDRAQERYLLAVRACGGIASFITHAEQLECLV